MNKRLPIDISEIEKHYRIEEDGSVFSLSKQRYLRSVPNSAGYLHVCLHLYMPNKFFLVHRIVATKFNGPCPQNMEACHSDGNKWNNYFTNIVYKTHSNNILQSYQEHGRLARGYNKLPTHPFSYETKQLMAEAKKKPVLFSHKGIDTTFPSIEIATKELNTYRKKAYLCITHNKEFNNKITGIYGAFLSFI
jgi:hypothetical protein